MVTSWLRFIRDLVVMPFKLAMLAVFVVSAYAMVRIMERGDEGQR